MDGWGGPPKAAFPLTIFIFRRIKARPVHARMGWGSGRAVGRLSPISSSSSANGPTSQPFSFETETMGRGRLHDNHTVQSPRMDQEGEGVAGGRHTSPVLSGTKVALEDPAFSKEAMYVSLGLRPHHHMGLWTKDTLLAPRQILRPQETPVISETAMHV